MRRSCGRFALVAAKRFAPEDLFRQRARRWDAIDARLKAVAPLYKRRDLLGAHLYYYLSRAGVTTLALDDPRIESVSLVGDEETGTTRISVRHKRQRKAAA